MKALRFIHCHGLRCRACIFAYEHVVVILSHYFDTKSQVYWHPLTNFRSKCTSDPSRNTSMDKVMVSCRGACSKTVAAQVIHKRRHSVKWISNNTHGQASAFLKEFIPLLNCFSFPCCYGLSGLQHRSSQKASRCCLTSTSVRLRQSIRLIRQIKK